MTFLSKRASDTDQSGTPKTGLRRELGLLEAAALSISIMAPTAGIALNGSLSASYAGAGTALAFLLAFITIVLVSYAFTEFAKQYATSGSVYRFNSTALGVRIGFLSGWTLLFTYAAFSIGNAALVAIFFQTFLAILGVSIPWIVSALASLALILLFGIRRIRLSTQVTFIVECLSVSVILVLVGFIAAKGAAHGFSLKPFSPVHIGLSKIALGSVFAFLGFAGFEGAAVLGEETSNPKVAIPRALKVAVFSVGILTVGVIYVQAEGFGLGPVGVKAFAASSGPLSQLATSYVGRAMAAAIAAGATVSGFAAALGAVTGTARLLYTFGRDRLLPPRLGRTTQSTASPLIAVVTVIVLAAVIDIVLYSMGMSAVSVFGDLGAMGVLALLIVYLATQVGAIRLFSRNRQWRPVQFLVPGIAAVLLGYALYGNLYPVPALPAAVFPYIVLAWILIGVVMSYIFRSRLRQVASSLVEASP
jgi:amino acid transporter